MREVDGQRPTRARHESGANARFVDAESLGWLLLPRDEFGFDAKDHLGVEILGASMEPLLPEGCLVLIDSSDKTPRKDGVYALRTADGRCAVKHVEIVDANRIALIPANRAGFRVEIHELGAGEKPEDRIIGKVMWRALRLKNAGGKTPGG